MAAIDKIYLSSWDQYTKFRDWCNEQHKLEDKYGKLVSISKYLYKYDKPFEGEHPVFMAPYYVDAYLIRNCPFDFIQEELMLNYGYWSQERIKNFYEDVKNWDSSKGECPYWAKLEYFIINEDGTMTIKGLEKSDYEFIKEGKLYNDPISRKYEYGEHFKCIKQPPYKYNTPFRSKYWWVSINVPDYWIMWYHDRTGTWDFASDFVDSNSSSNTAYVKTIKALKRKIKKWKLPIGTKVKAVGRYMFDEYEFIVKK